MNETIVTVSNPKDWPKSRPGLSFISTREYLTNSSYNTKAKIRVFNLAQSYRYQSLGYYVSLLAEARGHQVMPSITTIQDIKSSTLIKLMSGDLDDLIQKSLKRIQSDKFIISVYFGKNLAKQYDPLVRQLFNLLPAPMFRARFQRLSNSLWSLQSINAIAFQDVPSNHMEFFMTQALDYFGRKTLHRAKQFIPKYDLAVLYNPNEEVPPSNKDFFSKLKKMATKKSMRVDLLTKEDVAKLGEYDALFIRETTSVNHHTYRVARRAAADGLVVIDDPQSIFRCSNKVYLEELLQKNNILTPKTMIVHNENKKKVYEELGVPCILKKPDAAFSMGVEKVKTLDELKEQVNSFLMKSDLIIAQEFLPTPFDWRIGIINGEPLYACKYHMAKGHWQIADWTKPKHQRFGDVEPIPLWEVPRTVIKTALSASQLIGHGLYGVDLKHIDDKVYVIEVNDNPDIDAGVEDADQGDDLYLQLIDYFIDQIEMRRKGEVNY